VAFDRFAYARNNPVNLVDPSGHGYCDSEYADPEEGCPDVPLPDAACRDNVDCYDVYLAYRQLAFILWRLPTIEEILYISIGSEYWAYVDMEYEGASNPRSVGREAVARQYYQFCGTDGCTPSETYMFMSGYEQWTGYGGVIDGDEAQRARDMYGVLHNDFFGTGANLWEDVGLILDHDEPNDPAVAQNWIDGIRGNEPWQFFTESMPAGATFGWGSDNYAILAIGLDDGTYHFMFTALQTDQR
jgi:hypothetical protein